MQNYNYVDLINCSVSPGTLRISLKSLVTLVTLVQSVIRGTWAGLPLTAIVVLIFPKDHFVPGEKRTHTSKPCLGEALSLDINSWAIQRKTPMEIMWWEL